jgi:tuftelin-interacting protein 11
MMEVVNSLQNLSLSHASDSVEAVVSRLEVLQLEYKNEIDDHDLSEVAVGALHPLVSHSKPMFGHLANPQIVPTGTRIVVSLL